MNGRNVKKVVLSRSIGNQLARSNHKLRKAELQVAVIREFHQAGKEMMRVGSDAAAREEISGKYLIGDKRLGKARRFAEQYTAAEVDGLCALRKPDGSPLQVGHLDSLLGLPWKTESDRCKRAALEREAAEEGWTAPELAAEISARFPKTRRQSTSGKHPGRPRKTKRIDLATWEARALLRDLTCQIQISSGVDEQYVADLLELQSEAQFFAAMAIQALRRAA